MDGREIDELQVAMTEAKRRGAWISAAHARLVLNLVFLARRVLMVRGWNGVPEGHLPTVGDSRRGGLKQVTVYCENCRSSRRFKLDDLPLQDGWVFVEIPRHLRFRCIRCQGGQVTVRADWPYKTPGERWKEEAERQGQKSDR